MSWETASNIGRFFGDIVGCERKLFTEEVGELASEIVDIAFVGVGEAEFIDYWEENLKERNGHQGVGVVGAEDAPHGAEKQRGLNRLITLDESYRDVPRT